MSQPAALEMPTDLDDRYRNALFAFFLRRTGDRTDAEDLVQEVFMRLLSSTQGDQGNAQSAALVFTIAANLLRDRGRRAAVRAKFAMSSSAGETSPNDVLTPERILISRSEVEQAFAALNEVSERSRQIFTMFRFDKMSQREIAEHFGISRSAVEKNVARVLMHLNQRLDR